MDHLMIFSALYLIVASLSPVMGVYALRLHKEGAVNRSFFFISLCFMIWALGFSVIVVAPNEASAAFWTRISSIGVELVYSAMVHFALLITGHTKLLKKKWFLALLYLPAAICLYAFVLSPEITGRVLHFSRTAAGWIRNTPSTVFDSIFQIYYIASLGITLLLFFFWRRRDHRAEVKKQADLLMGSFALAIGLGSITDIVNPSLWHLPLPQMAPIFFLIPLYAIFQCISRYQMMRVSKLHEEDLILNDERRIMVFRVASFGLIAGGVVLFVLEHFWWNAGHIALTLLASAFLVALGAILLYVQRTRKGFRHLELLLILTTLVVTPILAINMAPMGGNVMWAFPILMIVSALVFSSKDMLLSSSLTLVMSQIYLWGTVPEVTIPYNYRTYLSRIIILLFISGIAYAVHDIYTARLRENAAQARKEALINHIAARFTLSDREDAPERMAELMRELTAFFDASKVFICAVENDFGDLIGMYEHTADGSEFSEEHKMLCMERWDAYQLETPPPVMRYEVEPSAEQLEKLRKTPWRFLPVLESGRPVAFIYLESSHASDPWTNEQLGALPIISRIVSDALEKLSSEVRIKYMAYYDALTHLPNRQLFHDRAGQAIHLARRENRTLGFLFLDLDFFKAINDTLGHEGGDQILEIIGQKFSDCLRKTDTVARFGGDEFLVLLNNIADVDDIARVADKLMAVFKDPFSIQGQEVFVTASAGISVFPVDGEDAQTLIKHADIAMYTAKDKGKNQYAFCSGNMKELVHYRVNLSNSLYRALDRRELRVFYQPQIDLSNEKIVGLEALLRWQHPEYGMLAPGEFISLAEQTGLINPIGAWVLETACAQAAAWEKNGFGSLRVAVNISVVQLRSPDFVEQVATVLKKTGIDPAQLELEITESTMTREPDYLVRVLGEIKALGVSLSIDDFGIEYSSLNRLKMLPVDRLKMDMQFVRGIGRSEKDQAITMVIMNLAKNMDVKLIAEGVENSTQLDFLKTRDCDEVQGYFYYKPMPAEQVEEVLKK